MRYSAPLDGIRAIAILAVLIFHISPATLRGGFVGVDVFFVLSGFLITSIILHDIKAGRFSLREFYLRRVQRLLPNVVVTVLAVLVLWTCFMPPSAAVQAGRHGFWTVINLSNIFILRNLGGYWGNAAEWSPLTHTWSLGIEEQFYFLFPGSLLLLAKFMPRRVGLVLVLATLSSFGMCLYGTWTHPTATFYLLPTRVWELLVGAALAAYRIPQAADDGTVDPASRTNALEALGVVGLVLILAGFFGIDERSGFPGLVVLAPTVGTAFVLWSIADGHTRFSRFLSTSGMVWTGKLSYSIYLWHWPLITLGKALAGFYGVAQLYGSLAGGAAGILLAIGAYFAVEQPLRRRGSGRAWRFAIIGTGFAVVTASALVVSSRRPIADPTRRFDTPTFSGELFTAGKADGAREAQESTRYYDVYFPPMPAGRPGDLWRSGGVIHAYGGGKPQVVVMGSSHALMYSRLIDAICRDLKISVAFLGMDAGTPALFNTTRNWNFSSEAEAREFDSVRRKWILEWNPSALFLIDRWDSRAGDPGAFDEDLRHFLASVGTHAKNIYFVAQVPTVKEGGDSVNLREYISWRMRKDGRIPSLTPDTLEPVRKQALAIAKAHQDTYPNLRILRADLPFYKDDGSIRFESGRAFFYADGDHLSDVGAEAVRGLFQSAIEAAANRGVGPASKNQPTHLARNEEVVKSGV